MSLGESLATSRRGNIFQGDRAEGRLTKTHRLTLAARESAPASVPARKEKSVEMLDEEVALKAAGVARLSLPGLGRGKGGRVSDIDQAGPWLVWKGRPLPPTQLGGRAAAAAGSMGLEKDAVRIKENDR